MQQKHTQLARLLEIMERLRDPETGCPWDVKQTFETIAPYTIEEAYEVSEAIASGDRDKICDELGDLLLQVVFMHRWQLKKTALRLKMLLNRLVTRWCAVTPRFWQFTGNR